MPTWKPIVGLSFTPEQFDSYCHALRWTAWRPSFIVLHNTYVPSLAQRPSGFTARHMQNLVNYYRDEKKWSAGPHLFIDDKKIWVFTPLTLSGIHSPSWNKLSLGVEMLGDYTTESFTTGRGLKVHQHTVAALATLCAVPGLDPAGIRFHKEDPLTTHKTCPGKNVVKKTMIAEVQALLAARHGGGHGEE
jgi:N-acetylmuramoyl-L-alanine amidase CwlA